MELGQETIQMTKSFQNVSYGWMEGGNVWASVTVADIQPQIKRDPQGNNFMGTHVVKIKLVNPDGTPNTDLGKLIQDSAIAIGTHFTLHCTMETAKSGIIFKCVGVTLPDTLHHKTQKAS